jgi:DNA primase
MLVGKESELGISQPETELLLRYYRVVGPLIERAMGAIPFVWTTLPAGVGGPTIFHGPLSPNTEPKAPVVDVPVADGVGRYPALSAQRIEGLVRHGAVELYSWSPTPADPTRLRFARILVETASPAAWMKLEEGVYVVEQLLDRENIQYLRVYDGRSGIALWIPFSDAPAYDDVRMWLYVQCAQAVLHKPRLLTLQPNSHGGPPVHLHVQTNAVGRLSVLPYSVRGTRGFPVAMPIDMRDLDDDRGEVPYINGNVLVKDFERWKHRHDDPFSTRPQAFYTQRFGDRANPRRQFAMPEAERNDVLATPVHGSHGPIVSAAITVLHSTRRLCGRAAWAVELPRHDRMQRL